MSGSDAILFQRLQDRCKRSEELLDGLVGQLARLQSEVEELKAVKKAAPRQ